jgi:hypothetical protein
MEWLDNHIGMAGTLAVAAGVLVAGQWILGIIDRQERAHVSGMVLDRLGRRSSAQ